MKRLLLLILFLVVLYLFCRKTKTGNAQNIKNSILTKLSSQDFYLKVADSNKYLGGISYSSNPFDYTWYPQLLNTRDRWSTQIFTPTEFTANNNFKIPLYNKNVGRYLRGNETNWLKYNWEFSKDLYEFIDLGNNTWRIKDVGSGYSLLADGDSVRLSNSNFSPFIIQLI